MVEVMKNSQEAVDLLEEANRTGSSLRPVPTDAWYYLGRAYHLSGDFHEAINCYDRFRESVRKKEQRDYNIEELIDQCTAGSGSGVEETVPVSDPVAEEVKIDTIVSKPEIEGEVDTDSIPQSDSITDARALVKDTPSDYDMIAGQALEFQFKADSLSRLANRYRSTVKALTGQDRETISKKILELETLTFEYQSLADKKLAEAARYNRALFDGEEDFEVLEELVPDPVEEDSPDMPPYEDKPGIADKEIDSVIIRDPILVLFDPDCKQPEEVPVNDALPEGWDYYVENVNWSEDMSKIIFTSPYLGTTQIFNLDLNSGAINQVSKGKFNYGPLQLNGNTILSGLQSMAMARELATVDLETGQMTQISHVNKHIYDNITMGESEERYIKTSDGKDLQMWVIYPPGFDSSKKYPALLYCKGGPQGSLGQGWSYRWNYQMMAANGYIVVAPNRRGNTGFGSYWREQISGDYGGKNMQDYLDAIDYMAKEPFVDEERLGSVGASYGGYSVFWLAGIHEKRFKAFISHCGMYNIDSWVSSTEELWFPKKDIGGFPWDENKAVGYKYSPHLNVSKWDTPILIITGEHDYRIPYTQSLEAFTAAQMNGVPSRLLFFHDGTHFVTRPHDAVIWQREFFEWLDTYLK